MPLFYISVRVSLMYVAVVIVVPDVRIDIVSKTSYDERWAAFAKLVALPVKKVVFNAQARSKRRTIGVRLSLLVVKNNPR